MAGDAPGAGRAGPAQRGAVPDEEHILTGPAPVRSDHVQLELVIDHHLLGPVCGAIDARSGS